MTQARTTLVSLDDTPWYHCVNRCVRRAFLCGEDHQTGQNYEHRRGWIADRIQQLAGVFAIDVAAYAVMSNHFHVVLHVGRERAEGWSRREVLERWTRLFQGPLVVRHYLKDPETFDRDQEPRLDALVETYRQRLFDLSWYMRALNEYIARQANAEDGVTGRFWEGRFKSQALLDEAALLAVMAYVDLNPVRAGMADCPEKAEHTAIHARIRALREEATADHGEEGGNDAVAVAVGGEGEADGKEMETGASRRAGSQLSAGSRSAVSPALVSQAVDATDAAEEAGPILPKQPLMPFDATGRAAWAIPFAFDDYLQLLDWTGRAIQDGKRGHVPDNYPPILDRLGITPVQFVQHAGNRMHAFGSAIGKPASLVQLCERRQLRFLRGIQMARSLFAGSRAA